MSDVQVVEKATKPVVAVTKVEMTDGRSVEFVGKRRMDKEYLIDASKIEVDGGLIQLSEGAVSVRIDFINGKTLTFIPPASIVAQALGHGLVQKLGDEAASEKDVDDAFIAIEELAKRLSAGEWRVAREASGGFSGASVVIRAISEASGKTVDEVKSFLDGKLAAAEARGEKLTRQALYASFRNPKSKTGAIIARMEEEKVSKGSAVDADAELAALSGS